MYPPRVSVLKLIMKPLHFKLVASVILLTSLSVSLFGEAWSLNSFPGPGHKAHSGTGPLDFPAFQGSDRSEQLTGWGVSPHDFPEGWWIMYTTDLGHLDISVNGKPGELANFTPSTLPFIAPKSPVFHPHSDGDLSSGTELWAYVLAGSNRKLNGNGFSGMWRTRDKGQSWEQVFSEPLDDSNLYELYARPTGDEILVDPHPDRAGHVYYAHYKRGLFRSKVAGSEENASLVLDSWETIAFPGFRIKHLSACVNGGETVLYMVVVADPQTPSDKRGAVAWMTIGQNGTVVSGPEAILGTFGSDVDTITVHPQHSDRGYVVVRGIPYSFIETESGFTTQKLYRGNVRGDIVRISPKDANHIVFGGAGAVNTLVASDAETVWSGGMPSWVGGTDSNFGDDSQIFPLTTVTYDDGFNFAYANTYLTNVTALGPINWRGDNPNLPAESFWSLDLTGPALDGGTQPSWGTHGPGGGEVAYSFLPGTGDAENPMWIGVLGMSWMRGFKVSKDGGHTWEDYGYGTQQKRSNQTAFGGSSNVIGVTRDEQGMQITKDGGLSWRSLIYMEDPAIDQARADAGGETPSKSGYGVAFDPDNPDNVLALFGRIRRSGDFASVLYSTNFGTSWEKAWGIPEIAEGKTGKHSAQIFWVKSTEGEQIYAEHYRCDDPDNPAGSWTDIGHRVLNVHPKYPNIIIGSSSSVSGNQGRIPWIIQYSEDAGQTWTELPAIPMETSFSTQSDIFEIKARGVNSMDRRKLAAALDPSDAFNPLVASNHPIRLLLAGRSGIYEYRGLPGNPAGGEWRLLNNTDFDPMPLSGQLADADVNTLDIESGLLIDSPEAVGPRPYMDQIIFDPTMPHIVYAFHGDSNISYDSHRNPNILTGEEPLPLYFAYRSIDGGYNWHPLHGDGFNDIIDNNRIIGTPALALDGTLAVSNTSGLFTLPRIEGTSVPDDVPPVAAKDTYVTEVETLLTVDAANGILANDAEYDLEPMTVELPLVSEPMNGQLTMNVDGSFTYTPDAGFSGVDFFRYQALDGSGNASPRIATVEITVTGGVKPQENHLVHYWTFDETEGTQAGDSSPISTSQGISLDGGSFASNSVMGPWANAVALDGSDNYFGLGQLGSFKSEFSQRSFALFVMADDLDGTQTILNEGGSVKGAGIQLLGSELQVRFLESGLDPIDLSTTIGAGTWYHVVAIFDGIGNRADLYVTPFDAYRPMLVDSVTGTGVSSIGSHGNPGALGATNQDDVWYENPDNTKIKLFHGRIDEMRTYNRVLSFDDVDLLFLENNDTLNSNPWEGPVWTGNRYPFVGDTMWKYTEYGWLYDLDYPYVFLLNASENGSYFLIYEAGASPTSFYAYSWAHEGWLWMRTGIGGWAYAFSTGEWIHI